MAKMRAPERRLKRLQPAVGWLVFAMGLTTLVLFARRGIDSKGIGAAGMSGMMALGGLGLIFKSSPSRSVALLAALLAVLVAGGVAWMAG